MTPPQAQLQTAVLGKAGKLLTVTLTAPGFQGPVGTGMQGMGVSTPKAAAVADATVGLARDVQVPKGRIFTSGTKSMMVAAGGVGVTTGGPLGITTRLLGAEPKGMHCRVAPMQVCIGTIEILLANTADCKRLKLSN